MVSELAYPNCSEKAAGSTESGLSRRDASEGKHLLGVGRASVIAEEAIS